MIPYTEKCSRPCKGQLVQWLDQKPGGNHPSSKKVSSRAPAGLGAVARLSQMSGS